MKPLFALIVAVCLAAECSASPCPGGQCFAPRWLAIESDCQCPSGGKCTCGPACECAEQTCFKNKPIRKWFKKHFGRCG